MLTTNDLRQSNLHPAVVSKIGEIVGERWASSQLVDRAAYCHDIWLPISSRAHLGEMPYLPDMVVWPQNAKEVSEILAIAREHKIPVVPYAGGSGVVGGAVPLHNGITLDVKRMDSIKAIDKTSQTVTVGAGMLLHVLEEQLNLAGFTLGHFPQSMYSAAIAGCVAHNGIGTFSTKYGKFDDMLLGMEVVLPSGEIINIPSIPKRSTGPNLNGLFLGSEGTLGVITEATMKIHSIPEKRIFQSFGAPSMRTGLDVIRRILQHDVNPAVIRLYDEIEGKGLLFDSLNIREAHCLLVFIHEGYARQVEMDAQIVAEICAQQDIIDLGPEPSKFWYDKKRFDVRHYMSATRKPSRTGDTLEVAATWDRLADLYYEIREAMEKYPCRSMGHLSHAYLTGANLYMIFFAEAASEDPEEVQVLYNNILRATFETCARLGATISHHHGVGLAKRDWMHLEHGEAGLALLRKIKKALDPDNIMNPGKLGLGEE